MSWLEHTMRKRLEVGSLQGATGTPETSLGRELEGPDMASESREVYDAGAEEPAAAISPLEALRHELKRPASPVEAETGKHWEGLKLPHFAPPSIPLASIPRNFARETNDQVTRVRAQMERAAKDAARERAEDREREQRQLKAQEELLTAFNESESRRRTADADRVSAEKRVTKWKVLAFAGTAGVALLGPVLPAVYNWVGHLF